MKYIEKDLVAESAAGGVECLLCCSTFTAPKKSNIKHHYTVRHNYIFEAERNSKRSSASGLGGKAPKQPNCAVLHNNFENRDDYINVCVLHASQHVLPFRYWDSETTMAIHEPFNTHFDVRVNSRTMREHFATMSDKIKDQIRIELRGRLFSVKFDIGSRFKKSFLGVSVQFMTNFTVKVVHMGMIVMHQRNKSAYIKERIEEILRDFGLNVEQIYTITTDNGTNVIKTSKDMLTQVAMLAEECVAEEVDDNIIVLDDEDDDMDTEGTTNREDAVSDAITITDADSDDETEDDILEEEELTRLAEATVLKGAASTIPLR